MPESPSSTPLVNSRPKVFWATTTLRSANFNDPPTFFCAYDPDPVKFTIKLDPLRDYGIHFSDGFDVYLTPTNRETRLR